MGSIKAPYLFRKRGIFYIRKRIPKELIGQYGRAFVQKSLRTSDRSIAVRLSGKILDALEHEWRQKLFELPDEQSAFEFFCSRPVVEPRLSDACNLYCQMKNKTQDRRFVHFTNRVVGEVISLSGDKAISAYTRTDALKFRNSLLERAASSGTVKRNFECIRAIWNFAARENGINATNPFANMNYGSGKGPNKRKPIPIQHIQRLQASCAELDDDIRWLIAVLSDSGMRLAEVTGLVASDIHLDTKMPFIALKAHPWRPLKTVGSQRVIPLVGASLWGLKRAMSVAKDDFLFPRYCCKSECKSDYASNSLNKWLRNHVPDGCVVHSFRHSMRDRLRAVQCPSNIIDQIGGWRTAGVGQGYGDGYKLDVLYPWMRRILLPAG
jgi:integrase